MLMSEKTTKVFLLVEAEVRGFNSLEYGDHVEMARVIVENAINKGSCNFTGEHFTFTWKVGQVLVGKPTVLPGDIKDIIWRDSIRNLPLHEQLCEAVERENANKTPAERWQALIDRGAINEKGEVLIRGPWEPNEEGE
jgi:hypothetical protein